MRNTDTISRKPRGNISPRTLGNHYVVVFDQEFPRGFPSLGLNYIIDDQED